MYYGCRWWWCSGEKRKILFPGVGGEQPRSWNAMRLLTFWTWLGKLIFQLWQCRWGTSEMLRENPIIDPIRQDRSPNWNSNLSGRNRYSELESRLESNVRDLRLELPKTTMKVAVGSYGPGCGQSVIRRWLANRGHSDQLTWWIMEIMVFQRRNDPNGLARTRRHQYGRRFRFHFRHWHLWMILAWSKFIANLMAGIRPTGILVYEGNTFSTQRISKIKLIHADAGPNIIPSLYPVKNPLARFLVMRIIQFDGLEIRRANLGFRPFPDVTVAPDGQIFISDLVWSGQFGGTRRLGWSEQSRV